MMPLLRTNPNYNHGTALTALEVPIQAASRSCFRRRTRYGILARKMEGTLYFQLVQRKNKCTNAKVPFDIVYLYPAC